jgi:hypothetical protein
VESSEHHGCLWFVDVTGAYSVRAHCMGGGEASVRTTETESKTIPFADVINQQLLGHMRSLDNRSNFTNVQESTQSRPYMNITTDEAFVFILDLLSSKKIQTSGASLVPPRTRLEIVSIRRKSQSPTRMIRHRVSDIWGKKKKRTPQKEIHS